MSKRSDTEEKLMRLVTPRATRPAVNVEAEEQTNPSDEMLDLTERIAEATERIARATELILWLIVSAVVFSLLLSVAVAIAVGWL